jgi:hypothetical protein
MAQILQDFGQELESEKLKNAQTNYKIPENCPSMGVPLTNKEIRKCLDSATKSMDVRIYNTQGLVANAATALTHCSDLIAEVNKKLKSKNKKEVKANRAKLADVSEKLADAMSVLGHVNHSLSQKRRDMHKFCLPKDSAGICENSVEMNAESLFPPGAEFHKAMKEVKAARKLEKEKRSGHTQGPRSGASGRGGRGSHSFLGRGYHHYQYQKHQQWKNQYHGYNANKKGWKPRGGAQKRQ